MLYLKILLVTFLFVLTYGSCLLAKSQVVLPDFAVSPGNSAKQNKPASEIVQIEYHPSADEIISWDQNRHQQVEENLSQKAKKSFFKTVVLFGWVGEVYTWAKKDSIRELSDKEEHLREKWKQNFGGRDIFHLYYKYDDARQKIREATRFEVKDFTAEADYDPLSQDVNLRFKKEF